MAPQCPTPGIEARRREAALQQKHGRSGREKHREGICGTAKKERWTLTMAEITG